MRHHVEKMFVNEGTVVLCDTGVIFITSYMCILNYSFFLTRFQIFRRLGPVQLEAAVDDDVQRGGAQRPRLRHHRLQPAEQPLSLQRQRRFRRRQDGRRRREGRREERARGKAHWWQ